MRPMKFRAKDKDGDLIFGTSLFYHGNQIYIGVPVIRKTIAQLVDYDEDGNKIYKFLDSEKEFRLKQNDTTAVE